MVIVIKDSCNSNVSIGSKGCVIEWVIIILNLWFRFVLLLFYFNSDLFLYYLDFILEFIIGVFCIWFGWLFVLVLWFFNWLYDMMLVVLFICVCNLEL